MDAAGNTAVQTIHLTQATAIPLTVTSLTPSSGSSDVGVTFRPTVTFSRPIDPTTLDSSDFYATDTTGAVVPATVVPSDDGTFAWLFYTNPLPSRFDNHHHGRRLQDQGSRRCIAGRG